jgi:5'-deoxynucleotidase YfbR-like HD superfamily hydrolase
MSWIQTYTGRAIHFDRAPRPDEIDPIDISVALSRLARFNGHSRECYSVAQHSCIVATHVTDDALRLPALLHDAHEAYLGDVVTPLKDSLKYTARAYATQFFTERDPIRELAVQFDKAIGERFGFDPELLRHPLIVEADARALATEKRDLVTYSQNAWRPTAEPYDTKILAVTHDRALWLFRDFFEMYGGR